MEKIHLRIYMLQELTLLTKEQKIQLHRKMYLIFVL
nr:MAG TPA: hypothetical protein [Caudoviricetes sp.]DAV54135.1 MAG TPA: hypothetical protein [Caudoviricetes sp.]